MPVILSGFLKQACDSGELFCVKEGNIHLCKGFTATLELAAAEQFACQPSSGMTDNMQAAVGRKFFQKIYCIIYRAVGKGSMLKSKYICIILFFQILPKCVSDGFV